MPAPTKPHPRPCTPAPASPTPSGQPYGGALARLLEERRSGPAPRLVTPGPSPRESRRMLAIAARLPDHGALAPWRFILVEGEARRRDAGATMAAGGTSTLILRRCWAHRARRRTARV